MGAMGVAGGRIAGGFVSNLMGEGGGGWSE